MGATSSGQATPCAAKKWITAFLLFEGSLESVRSKLTIQLIFETISFFHEDIAWKHEIQERQYVFDIKTSIVVTMISEISDPISIFHQMYWTFKLLIFHLVTPRIAFNAPLPYEGQRLKHHFDYHI